MTHTVSGLPLLYTSRYQAHEKIAANPHLIALGFTVGHPRWKLKYQLAGNLKELGPDAAWKDRDRDTFHDYYMRKLDNLGVEKIGAMLFEKIVTAGAAGAILLCFEDLEKEGEWCHRRMFADWWFSQTGQRVEEL